MTQASLIEHRPDSGRRRLLGLAGGALAIAGAGTLGGCASLDPTAYADQTPTLDLRRYFDGTLDAWGVFQDRSGRVVRRFTVVIRCSWDGDVGTLDEDFVYSDGTTQKRVWTLRRMPPGNAGEPGVVHWTGTAGDVIGEARGKVAGNAFNWQYTMALEVDGRTWHVDFDDWMYLMDERTMLNRAVMSKFGIRLGEVLLSFRKR